MSQRDGSFKHPKITLNVIGTCKKIFTIYVQNLGILTCKICLKRPLKINKTKVLKTDGSLMKVESIAECSLGAFCNTFDLH